MIHAHLFRSEWTKAVTLPGVWAGFSVGLLVPLALTALNVMTTRSAVLAGDSSQLANTSTWESVFASLVLGTVGAVIIGVMVVGSEYSVDSADSGGGHQLTTSLLAVPRRVDLTIAKTLVVTCLVTTMGAVTIPVCALVATRLSGGLGVETVTAAQAVARCFGLLLYWVLTAVMALAIAQLLRNVVVPLTLLIINNSLLSVSYLLSQATSLAKWLPDLAGRNLFMDPAYAYESLDVLPGAVIMATWTLGLLTLAAWSFTRRDA